MGSEKLSTNSSNLTDDLLNMFMCMTIETNFFFISCNFTGFHCANTGLCSRGLLLLFLSLLCCILVCFILYTFEQFYAEEYFKHVRG